jgi:hypothetical protein
MFTAVGSRSSIVFTVLLNPSAAVASASYIPPPFLLYFTCLLHLPVIIPPPYPDSQKCVFEI